MAQIFTPRANNKPDVFQEHSIKRIDNYSWLRSAKWQEVLQKANTMGRILASEQ